MASDTSAQTFDLTDSPSFDHPPVVETALGIQFAELKGFRSVHYGQYFDSIRDRFGRYEDRAPLNRITETFPKVSVPMIQFAAVELLRPRVFFYDKDGDQKLVQVQPDRFGFNWRRSTDGDAAYPRYADNVARFLDEFHQFVAFCADHDLGEVKPDICEVVYINRAFPVEGESAVELFANVFTGLEWPASDPFLPKPEAVTLNRTYEIGQQQGRLFAQASIATDRQRGDFVALKMIARTFTDSVDTVKASLNLAHKWAVQGFVSVTDPGIRKTRWRQQT